MSEINRCPKCKEVTLFNTSHRYIRDEWIRFTGKCLNCGYEVTPEEVFNQLKSKFDLEKDFEHLEKPVEYILDRCTRTDEEPRKQILQVLIKIYEEKTQDAIEIKEFEKFFDRFLNYRQALEGRALAESEILFKKGLYRLKCDPQKATAYLEEAFKQEDANKKEIAKNLADIYKQLGQFEKAIKFLDLGHQYREKPPEIPQCAEDLNNNFYLQNKGELLLKMGSYRDALKSLEQIKYTKEIMEYVRVTFTIERDKVEISKILEDSIIPLNLEAKELSFCAAYKARELDIAKSILYEINEVDEEKKFGVEYPLSDDNDDVYFLCLMSYLLETDKAKAYEIVKDADAAGDWRIYLLFLKGIVCKDYALSIQTKDKYRLLEDAIGHFKDSVRPTESWLNFVYDNPMFAISPSVFQSFHTKLFYWVSWFGRIEEVVPKVHEYIGEIYEKCGDTATAFHELKLAQELNNKFGNPENKTLESKIENLSTRIGALHEKEWDKNLEELGKLTKELGKSQSDEAYRAVIHKINSILIFAKEKLPQIIEDVEDVKGDVERKKKPFKILPTFRDILEGILFQMYRVRTADYEKFTDFANDLERKGHINPYIRSIISFIWFSCSPASHSQTSPQIRSLKWEDVELIIQAMLRFLTWHREKDSALNV